MSNVVLVVTPLVIALIGCLIYAFAVINSKVSEVGRIIFFCGTFFVVYALAQHSSDLFR